MQYFRVYLKLDFYNIETQFSNIKNVKKTSILF